MDDKNESQCLECGSIQESPQDEDNCVSVQLPDTEQDSNPSSSKSSLQSFINSSLEGECLERSCSTCGSSYSLIPFFILETIWNRYPVLDSFPMVLCIRVNRFLINPQTYTISKNTTPVQVDEEIWVRQCDEET